MAVELFWAHNDGMRGRVWLDGGQLGSLLDEMLAQRMGWHDTSPGPGIPVQRLRPGGGRVLASEIEEALAIAEVQPHTEVDQRLWLDWLRFLEGAAANGGIVAR